MGMDGSDGSWDDGWCVGGLGVGQVTDELIARGPSLEAPTLAVGRLAGGWLVGSTAPGSPATVAVAGAAAEQRQGQGLGVEKPRKS